MVHCSIIGCKSRSERKEANITFHTFPKDLAIRKSWILATGRSDWAPGRYDRICSKHFLENYFRKTPFKVYLIAFSIPTEYVHKHQEKVAFTESTLGDTKINEPYSEKDSGYIKNNSDLQSESCVNTLSVKTFESTTSTDTEATNCEISCLQNTFNNSPISERTYSPQKQKLIRRLKKQTLLAEKRKQKLAVIRSRNRRLEEKNAVLLDVISELKSKILSYEQSSDLILIITPENENSK